MTARGNRFLSVGGFSFNDVSNTQSPSSATQLEPQYGHPPKPHLQLILDLTRLALRRPDRKPARLALAAAQGGVDSIQVRGKALGAGELLDQALSIIRALRQERLSVAVLVNERLDVALLAGADGVHLPEASFSPVWARPCKELARQTAVEPVSAGVRVRYREVDAQRREGDTQRPGVDAQRRFLVGRSIHSSLGVEAPGTEDLDYVLFGHVFETESKAGTPPRGLSALAQVVAVSPVPVYAVGGIDPDNAADVIHAGAAGIAVISAILDAPDPLQAAMALRHAVDAAWKRRLGSMSG